MNSNDLADQEIQKIIESYNDRQDSLLDRLSTIHDKLRGIDENIYRYVIWRGKEISDMPSARILDDKLSNILVNMDRKKNELALDLIWAADQLDSEYRKNKRVISCYKALPYEEYRILYLLYERKVCWQALPDKTKQSKTTVRARRHSALKKIRTMYSSPMTNYEILATCEEPHKGPPLRRPREGRTGYEKRCE